MKAVHIALVVISITAASAAYVLLRPAPESAVIPEPVAVEPPARPEPEPESVTLPDAEPAQPLEEREDAMLFEIDALQHMPFDESIIRPFD